MCSSRDMQDEADVNEEVVAKLICVKWCHSAPQAMDWVKATVESCCLRGLPY